MNNSQKGFIVPIIIGIVVLIAIGGGTFFYTSNQKTVPDTFPVGYDAINIEEPINTPITDNVNKVPVTVTPAEPVFCTMDAFECPDGSWVGRTGPNCEFVCPIETD